MSMSLLVGENELFKEFKGALTEQYVLQQLKTILTTEPFYWSRLTSGKGAEIDFLVQISDEVVPIEVKASINLQSKSLASYRKDFSPAHSVRTSLATYREHEDGLIDIPLYAIGLLEDIIKAQDARQ